MTANNQKAREPLKLSALQHLSVEHKAILFEAMSLYLDTLDASAYALNMHEPARVKERAVAESIMGYTSLKPFKKIPPFNWSVDWKNGVVKGEFLSWRNGVQALDIKARVREFLLKHDKNPSEWKIKSAKRDKESGLITIYVVDEALKGREERKRQRYLRMGTKKGRKKKVKEAPSKEEVAESLTIEELMKMAKERGLTI